MRLDLLKAFLLATCALNAFGATFGTVVVIGGHASDIALDERRGQLFIANFGGKRIDVMSTSNNQLRTPIRVDPEPESIALSPDERYLLVMHYDIVSGTAPALTIIDLDANTQSPLPIPQPPPSSTTATPAQNDKRVPLSIAFGNGSNALLVTNLGIYVVDPAAATLTPLAAPPLLCGKLPVPFATFPPQISRAVSGISGDGQTILVAVEYISTAAAGATPAAASCSVSGPTGGPETLLLRYDIGTGGLTASGTTSVPPLGPRVVSPNRDATNVLIGWSLVDTKNVNLAQFPYPAGSLNIGGHAYDYARNLIYAQIPSSAGASAPSTGTGATTPAPPAEAPVLHVLDTDNLTVRERIRLAENLAGKAVFSRDMKTLYAISDSGVTVLPIGSLASAPKVTARQEQVLFRSNNCDNRPITQVFNIDDASGGGTDFTLSLPGGTQGVHLSQTSGTTPARISVEIDPGAFRGQTGTTAIPVTITSAKAINIPDPIRFLINAKEPDQRGLVYELPGKIVDIMSDVPRHRVYAIRQDRNQVIVLDSSSFGTTKILRTGNTPTQMALTRDNRYLIVGNDNSQIASVFDLETLQKTDSIVFPGGHYPRSIAASNSAILGIARNVGKTTCEGNQQPPAVVDRIDFANRVATMTCEVGFYNNNLTPDSLMVASPSGGSIFTMMADGTVLLYNDSYDAFEASRKDSSALAGSYAAVSDDTFIAGGSIFNASLVTTGTLANPTAISGLLTVGNTALTAGGASPSAPGTIQRVSLSSGDIIRTLRSTEAPVNTAALKTTPVGQIGQSILSFLRIMATTDDGTVVYLSTSGLTALAPGFDAPAQLPAVSSVVNSADGGGVAPGSLITITGVGLTAGSGAASNLPLPTTLGEMCAAVNNIALPLIRVAPDRIDAQLPFEVTGNGTLVITAPSGKSAPFNINVSATAPAVFRTGVAGDATGLPLIYRAASQDLVTFSSPIHPDDVLVIFATGLGITSPTVISGAGSPSDLVAVAVVQPTVKIGDTALQVAFAGLVPGQVGLYQINAVVPHNIPSTPQTVLTLSQGTSSTTFPVRVVSP